MNETGAHDIQWGCYVKNTSCLLMTKKFKKKRKFSLSRETPLAAKGHFTHKTESMWPIHFKQSHWWKRRSQSKFASHYAWYTGHIGGSSPGPSSMAGAGPNGVARVWGTNRVCECKMNVKSTSIPTWHWMDHVSWSLGFIINNQLLEVGLTWNQETMAL